MRSLGRALRTILALLGITAAILVAAELGARLWLGRMPPPADVGAERALADTYAGAEWPPAYFAEFERANRTEWHPYVYWRRKPFQGEMINIDARGVRRTWRAPDTTAAARKVFVFGGSTQWGTGARDEHTVASYLARALAGRGIADVEVTNFGEGGWVSMQSLIQLEDELRRGNVPDVAVFLDGVNDIFAAFQNGVAGTPHNEANRVREFNIDVDGRIYREAIGSYLRSLALVRLMTPAPPPETTIAWTPELRELTLEAIRVYLGTVDIAARLAVSHGFTALFYWQPVLFTKQKFSPYEEKVAAQPDVPRAFYTGAYAVAAGALGGSPVRNLSDVFEADPEPAYIDFCHLGERGNRVIAEAMAEDVAAALTRGER